MFSTDRRGIFAGLVALCAVALAGAAHAQVPQIRLGYGPAAEEQLWLLIAKPDVGKHYGKAYTLEATRFTGSDKRAQAFEAGALDLASSSANGALFAAAEGVRMKIIASLSKESAKAFSTTYYALADSPIRTVKDLKGKTIGINGFSTSGHLWVKVALEKNGLTEKDVTLVPVRFPAMGEALRGGKIDVGMFPQPFAAMAEKDMKVRKIFTAKDAAPFDEELIVMTAKEEFLKKNAAAVKAFLEDLALATRFYIAKPREARQILIDTKMVRATPDVYLDMHDYYHDADLRVDAEALEKMQDLQLRAGFQKKRADVKVMVDNSYLPK